MNQSLDNVKKKSRRRVKILWKTEMSKEFSWKIIAFEITLVCNCEFLQFQKRANLRFIIIILGNFKIFLSFLHFRILIILSSDLKYLFGSFIFFLEVNENCSEIGIWDFSPLFKNLNYLKIYIYFSNDWIQIFSFMIC